MVEAIKQGRDVYTNIPLHADVWLSELGAVPVVFDSQDIIDNPKWFDDVLPAGAMLVLDECWRFWPAGLKANNVNSVHKEFLAMHGHKVNEAGTTTQIILVTQDLAQLSAFVRQLVDKTFRCTKLDAVGQDNRFRVDIYQGAVTGQNPPPSQRLREMFETYKSENFKFYKSASQSKAGDVGNEKRVDDRANILKGGKIKSMLAAMVILPILAVFLGWRTYHNLHKDIDKGRGASASLQTSRAVPENFKAAQELANIRAAQSSSVLHGRKIVITAASDYGKGVEYVFRVDDGDNYARFDQKDLIQAGYKVQPVAECMVKISGYNEVFYAMCEGEKSVGVIAQAFQAPKDSNSL